MEKLFSNNDGIQKLPVRRTSHSPRQKMAWPPSPRTATLQPVVDINSSATFQGQTNPYFYGQPRYFPLTAERLAELCTHCWLPGQMVHLSRMTGEEAFLGYFHHQKLLSECQILLKCPVWSTDTWALQEAVQTFWNNRHIFMCESILLVLITLDCYTRNSNYAMTV